MSQRLHRERSSALRPSDHLPDWLAGPDFSDEERRHYARAARRMGMEIGHWARQVLNRAAGAVAGAAKAHALPGAHASRATAHR
jgi:hypothetical protein